jgi:hypothetical protein
MHRDLLAQFHPAVIDLDPLVHPTKHAHPSIPETLGPGALLQSHRHGLKCLLLDDVEGVDIEVLKKICLRRSDLPQLVYLPMGTTVYKDEVLHQGRQFAVKLPKGTLCLSPGGHPNVYLLEPVALPLTRELSSNQDILQLTEASAKRNLQSLVDIPASFSLAKEDQLYRDSGPSVKLSKGTLVVSRSGAVTGFLVEDVRVPLKKSVADLDALFPLKSTYKSYPIETLAQLAASAGSAGVPLDRGTFLFSPQGKVYFVWKEGLRASSQTVKRWGEEAQIIADEILNVSTTQSNKIGGPGVVITQDQLNYLHDVFRQTGTTNISRETLLLDQNVFYKFVQAMPYAHTGRYRSYLKTGQVVMLNTFRKGTFNVEVGGKDITITDVDLVQIRKHLEASGRILIRIGSLLRITDERRGDWIYRAASNLFYSYDTLTRPLLEEFIPETVAYQGRGEKISTLIGPQEKPQPEDRGTDGAPLADLLAVINLELGNERIVFVLDGTLFHWRGRLYRVNEELVFRPQQYTKVEPPDLAALESEWKIHQMMEEVEDGDEEIPAVDESDADLDDLPFDNSTRT